MAATPVPHVLHEMLLEQEVVLKNAAHHACLVQSNWSAMLVVVVVVVAVVVVVVVVVIDFPRACTFTEPVYQYSEHRLSIIIVCSM